MAQQQLADPVARAHQIAAHVLARPDQVAQRLLLAARDPDRVQSADHQQPHEPLGVTAVGLHTILRRPLDLARRRHHAPDTRRLKRPREAELVGSSYAVVAAARVAARATPTPRDRVGDRPYLPLKPDDNLHMV
jgi:hypothetical protein